MWTLPHISRCAPVVAGATALTLLVAPGAPALDDAKPEPTCAGLAFKDAKSDQGNTVVPADQRTESTELLGGFLKHEPLRGAEATTYNLQVADLKAAVPTGWTTISWSGFYATGDGTVRFVRATLDFGGGTAFEYGTFTPGTRGQIRTGVSQVEGDTTGKLFEGLEGVVQLVVPQAQAATGKLLADLYANTGQGRTLPTAADTQTRGVAHVMDQAGSGKYTVAACPPPSPDGPVDPTPTPTPPPDPPPTDPGDLPPDGPPAPVASLPVTVMTRSVAARRVRRTAVLRLRSSGAVRNLAAQLRRGRVVFAKGSLKRLRGSGVLRLRVARRLRKGTYTLELAGTDAAGRRLLTSASLKVR